MNTNLDQIAEKYDSLHEDWKNLETTVRHKEFQNFIKHVNSYDSVLEIGLGDGAFTELLNSKFKRTIAVDGSSKAIEILSNNDKLKEVEFVHSYAESIPANIKSKNIVMSHILEHINEPIEALKNIKNNNMLDETVLYISVPNAMSLHRQVAVKMGLLNKETDLNDRDITLGHVRVYTPETLKRDIISSGLNIIEFGGVMIKPLTNRQIEKDWNKDIINGYIELGNHYPEICGDIYIIAKK
ncbi:type 12 methyltransferase [Halobacteriovorax sp. BALOs_7]|uniref:Class I SAM-dependent methyltransferase n=1 Tax=Halobacteriovorax vibrionivorans TaxID=2152716 RepID=A0ABY0IJE7_9BACT|nr:MULTISPECIES: class I SAM-dependent methyltransferase [Halobacteriovorax]AYF43046.1 type 12 methyltransferase [Halobacteriovorax sp. BALOs_7]RZF23072.1 class I SAM-dependent methyltransferase [Halobacteriovorax vibrionivorans]TGD49296.1 class I SAM-dependent methyltransferase [Halobacteriovorax sp. Y22]